MTAPTDSRTPSPRHPPVSPDAGAFLLGHSHVDAMVHAAAHAGLPIAHLNLWMFGRPVRYGGGAPTLDPELDARLGPLVISTVGGSAHDVLGLGQHPRRFDFVLPGAPDLPLLDDAEVTPAAAIREALRSQIEDEVLDLLCLLARSGRRVIHLEPPPPTGDDPRLAQELGYMGFVAMPDLGPSGPWLRYKLWRLHSEILREVYEAAGVEFWPAPEASQDEHGFLRPEFYAYPGHANPAYGALALRQLGLIA